MYEASIILIPKNRQRYYKKRKLYNNISHEYTHKHLQVTSKLNPVYENCIWKRLYIITKWDFSQKSKIYSTSENQLVSHIISIENMTKPHDLNRQKKAFHKIQQSFMIKNIQQTTKRRKSPQPDKGYLQKSLQLTLYLMGKDWMPSSYDWRQDKDLLSALLFNTVLEVLTKAIGEEKEIWKYPDWKGRGKTTSILRWHNLMYRKS